MKRLLCILSSMNAGGAETFLMKIYRHLDKSQYQMDFCINVAEKCFYEDEINAMGGRIYRIPPKSENTQEFIRRLTDIVKKNNYEYVMRITSSAMGFMDLKIAHDAGARVCAARSSNSSDGKGIKPFIAHRMGRFLYNKYVNVKIAPSDLAAKYTFGNSAYKKGNVSILHNGVDIDFFSFSEEKRERIRNELNISDKFVVGHIGRFSKQKNHSFLLKVFAEIAKERDDAVLLLVGKGELEEEIKAEAAALGIYEKVIFAGVRTDIPDILSAMDTFLFPSFYEGMPNTVIEAQACGLRCTVSDTITREANITGGVDYLSLDLNAKSWAESVLSLPTSRLDSKNSFIENKYDIDSVVKDFVRIIFREDKP